MVYFQTRTVYKSGGLSIIVIAINNRKDRLVYRFYNGQAKYDAPIRWSRVRNQEHPVQYINVKGQRVWAYKS